MSKNKDKNIVIRIDAPTAERLVSIGNKGKFVRYSIRLGLAAMHTTAKNDPLACVHSQFKRTPNGEFCAQCGMARKDCEDFSEFFNPAMLFI